mmetsp:Transcript_122/g.418  ORF Transcript_122/g.418 Transcript_122/m.418 type:complete len:259 (-) Transcript_122:55-831(-)
MQHLDSAPLRPRRSCDLLAGASKRAATRSHPAQPPSAPTRGLPATPRRQTARPSQRAAPRPSRPPDHCEAPRRPTAACWDSWTRPQGQPPCRRKAPPMRTAARGRPSDAQRPARPRGLRAASPTPTAVHFRGDGPPRARRRHHHEARERRVPGRRSAPPPSSARSPCRCAAGARLAEASSHSSARPRRRSRDRPSTPGRRTSKPPCSAGLPPVPTPYRRASPGGPCAGPCRHGAGPPTTGCDPAAAAVGPGPQIGRSA